jgi:hypothetical protein
MVPGGVKGEGIGLGWYLEQWRPDPCHRGGHPRRRNGSSLLIGEGEIRPIIMSATATPRSTRDLHVLQPSSGTS